MSPLTGVSPEPSGALSWILAIGIIPMAAVNSSSLYLSSAETQPQALEWMFSVACGQRFRISADNLASDLGASEEFIQAVIDQANKLVRMKPLCHPRGAVFSMHWPKQFDKTDYRCSAQYQQAKLA